MQMCKKSCVQCDVIEVPEDPEERLVCRVNVESRKEKHSQWKELKKCILPISEQTDYDI